MVAPVHRSVFTHLWKTENHFFGFAWPVQSLDINIGPNQKHVEGHKTYVQKELSAINS